MALASRVPVALAILGALPLASCSWSRFDDVRKDPPVAIVDRPETVTAGFAMSVSGGGNSTLFVGGQTLLAGAAIFKLGEGDPPGASRSLCTDSTHCRLIGTPVTVTHAGRADCFVYALGKTGDNVLGSLLGSCGDGSDFTLEVPPSVESKVIERLLSPAIGEIAFLDGVALGASGDWVVAGSPDLALAWIYDATGSIVATVPAPSTSDGTFGTATAVSPSATGAIAAVSSPGKGQVYLFDVAAGGAASLRGCVARAAPWGVVMTMATEGARTALVVSDGSTSVDVLDLAKLGGGGTSCRDPGEAWIHGVHCVATGDASGCEGGGFGHSIAPADVNGDGKLELLVGVPGMNVRKINNAGAVQVFSLFGGDQPLDTLFVSGAKGEDRLGTSVAAVRIGGRDVIAAGAPGTERQEVALFYCSALGGAGAASPRCQ